MDSSTKANTPSPQQTFSSQGGVISGFSLSKFSKRMYVIDLLNLKIVHFLLILLLLSGDIELNPGPPTKQSQNMYSISRGIFSHIEDIQVVSNESTGMMVNGPVQVEENGCNIQRIMKHFHIESLNRVLHIFNIKPNVNYKYVYDVFSLFGQIENIALNFFRGKLSCMVLYSNALSAANAEYAVSNYMEHNILGNQALCEVLHFLEFGHPRNCLYLINYPDVHPRTPDKPSWFIGKSKPGKYQHLEVCKFIDLCVGKSIKVDIKRYGKDRCLIYAKTETQRQILEDLVPKSCDPLISVEPHQTFNNYRGVIFHWDLFYLKEEALKDCPPEVISIERMGEVGPALKVIFKGPGPYNHINIYGEVIPVQPLKPKPMICKNCFRYGHVQRCCMFDKTCNNCGAVEHGFCNFPPKCFHCRLDHKANDKNCSYYKKEVEILVYAETEHISVSEARRLKS